MLLRCIRRRLAVLLCLEAVPEWTEELAEDAESYGPLALLHLPAADYKPIQGHGAFKLAQLAEAVPGVPQTEPHPYPAAPCCSSLMAASLCGMRTLLGRVEVLVQEYPALPEVLAALQSGMLAVSAATAHQHWPGLAEGPTEPHTPGLYARHVLHLRQQLEGAYC